MCCLLFRCSIWHLNTSACGGGVLDTGHPQSAKQSSECLLRNVADCNLVSYRKLNRVGLGLYVGGRSAGYTLVVQVVALLIQQTAVFPWTES